MEDNRERRWRTDGGWYNSEVKMLSLQRGKGFMLSVQGGKGFTLSVRESVKDKQYTLILFFNFHLYGFRQRFLKALANMDL